MSTRFRWLPTAGSLRGKIRDLLPPIIVQAAHRASSEHRYDPRGWIANNARGEIEGDLTGMLKLIFARSDRRLLGVQILGENATELIHLGMMALESGMAIDVFIEFVFNYPTLSEMYKYAAYDGLGNLSGHKLREG